MGSTMAYRGVQSCAKKWNILGWISKGQSGAVILGISSSGG